MDILGSRKNYLSPDDTFIAIARVVARQSKDPITQTGAVVVDKNNKLLAVGYNDWAKGIKDGSLSWSNDFGENKKDILKTKYPYVVHAEVNAILNAGGLVEDGKIYCLLFPCNECAKIIIQSGIKTVFYEDDRQDRDKNSFAISKDLFDKAKVNYIKHKDKQ